MSPQRLWLIMNQPYSQGLKTDLTRWYWLIFTGPTMFWHRAKLPSPVQNQACNLILMIKTMAARWQPGSRLYFFNSPLCHLSVAKQLHYHHHHWFHLGLWNLSSFSPLPLPVLLFPSPPLPPFSPPSFPPPPSVLVSLPPQPPLYSPLFSWYV